MLPKGGELWDWFMRPPSECLGCSTLSVWKITPAFIMRTAWLWFWGWFNCQSTPVCVSAAVSAYPNQHFVWRQSITVNTVRDVSFQSVYQRLYFLDFFCMCQRLKMGLQFIYDVNRNIFFLQYNNWHHKLNYGLYTLYYRLVCWIFLCLCPAGKGTQSPDARLEARVKGITLGCWNTGGPWSQERSPGWRRPNASSSETAKGAIRINKLVSHRLLTCHGAKKPCVIPQGCFAGQVFGTHQEFCPGVCARFCSERDWMLSGRRICLKFWHALASHLPVQVLWPPFMVLITTAELRPGRTLVCQGITLTEADYGQRRQSCGARVIGSNEPTQGRGFSGVFPPLCPFRVFSFLFISIMCRSGR